MTSFTPPGAPEVPIVNPSYYWDGNGVVFTASGTKVFTEPIHAVGGNKRCQEPLLTSAYQPCKLPAWEDLDALLKVGTFTTS